MKQRSVHGTYTTHHARGIRIGPRQIMPPLPSACSKPRWFQTTPLGAPGGPRRVRDGGERIRTDRHAGITIGKTITDFVDVDRGNIAELPRQREVRVVGHQHRGVGLLQHVSEPGWRETAFQRHRDAAGFQHGQRGDDERRAMLEKHCDRLPHDIRPVQDGARDPVGSSIQLVVSEGMGRAPDGAIRPGYWATCCSKRAETDWFISSSLNSMNVPAGAKHLARIARCSGGKFATASELSIIAIAVARGPTGERGECGAFDAAVRRSTNGKGRDQIARST